MSKSPQSEYLAKVILIGDSGVGKTSVLMRWINNTFNRKNTSTQNTDRRYKKIETNSGILNICLWDMAGQEKYRTMTKLDTANSDGVFYIFSQIDRESFDRIKLWDEQVMKNNSPEIVKVLLGNKKDMVEDEDSKHIKLLEINQLSLEYQFKYFEISAALDSDPEIKNALAYMANEIMRKMNNGKLPIKQQNLILQKNRQAPMQQRGCCGSQG